MSRRDVPAEFRFSALFVFFFNRTPRSWRQESVNRLTIQAYDEMIFDRRPSDQKTLKWHYNNVIELLAKNGCKTEGIRFAP